VAAVALGATGCGGSDKASTTGHDASGGISRSAALAYAHAVNLRAGDIPGASTARAASEAPAPSAASLEFARCAGATDPRQRVADVRSPGFRLARPTGEIKSSVEVMPSAALARRSFTAASSARGRACISKLLPELLGRSAAAGRKFSHVSIRALPAPVAGTQSFGYRIGMTLGVSLKGAPRTVPIYLDAFELLHGPAEVGLSTFSVAQPPSATVEKRALTTLAARAKSAQV
jgi:hypothetical protein